MKNVIVTGGTGFIGEYLVNELVNQGYAVTMIVRNKSKIENFTDDRVTIIECKLVDIVNLKLERKYEIWFNFAWDGTSGKKRSDLSLQLSNIKNNCDLIYYASIMGVRRFVNAGSIMEYEAYEYILKSNSKPNLGCIYSTAKLAANMMGKTIAYNNNIDYVNLIISNIYGEGENSARFFNTIIKKMLAGEDIDLTEGNQTYDFIFVTDAVKQIILAGIGGKPYESYYIGNKEQRKLKEFVKDMKKITGSESSLNFGAIPMNGAILDYNIFEPLKIFNEFSVVVEIDFEQGVRKVYQELLDYSKIDVISDYSATN